MKLNDRPCPECGLPVPADAPEEVCPACSLQSLLKFISDTAQPEGSSSKAVEQSTLNPQPGVRFGDYELLELLARGGMGVVYKARQVSLNRTVALKMIQSGLLASPAEVKRFQAEAEAIAHLQHPNIVAIHEIGEHDGQPYFSMDYVPGRTLANIVRDGPLPATRAATYVRTIATAVHYAHQHGIIHRDLKPANVIIDEHDQPRITDFGLAKQLTSDLGLRTADLTLSGQVLGSPNYLPPEQAEPKRGAVGPPSDVYALGAILYHLVTGRPPFQAESLTGLLRQVIETDPVAPRSLNPGIPRDLETICLKCLEKESSRRYATAQALAEDLGRFLEDKPIQARPVSAAGKAWKWCQRRPAQASLGAALVLTLVAGLTAVLWQLRQTRASELLARQNAYAADMNLAEAALEKGDLGTTMSLLNAHLPTPGQRDLRGWEWRYFWQRCRGDQLFELTHSAITVERVAFSPDSRWLALRDEHANLALWDTKTRRRIARFKTTDYLRPFAFSSQDTLLAYATTQTQAVSIVQLDTLQQIAWLTRPTNTARLVFSADATRLFMLSSDGSLTAWEIASQRRLSSVKVAGLNFTDDDYPVLFSPDGHVLAFRVESGLGLCDVDSARQTQIRLPGIESSPTALSLSADGKLLAVGVGGSDSEIYVWEVEDLWRCGGAAPPPRWRLGKHRDWVCSVAFSPDGRALVSASADSAIRVWELEHPDTCRRYQGHQHQVLSVAWSPDGRYVASCSKDGSVRVWDPRSEPAASGPTVLPTPIHYYRFQLSRDAKTAILVEPTNRAAVRWDMLRMQPQETLDFAGTNLVGFAWSPDEKSLVTGDGSGNIRVWNLAGRRAITIYQSPGAYVGHLGFSEGGRFLCCGVVRPSGERSARMWRVEGWREIPLPSEAMNRLTWAAASPDGRLMLALHYGGSLDMWDIASGRCRARFSQPFAGSWEEGLVAFSPDGQSWVSSTQKGVVALWNTGEDHPTTLPRTAQEIWGHVFSDAGTRLLVTGKRSADVVRVLDTRSKRFVATLSAKPDVYWGARVSADGNTVYTVGEKTVLLWRAPSWAEIGAAEKKKTTP